MPRSVRPERSRMAPRSVAGGGQHRVGRGLVVRANPAARLRGRRRGICAPGRRNAPAASAWPGRTRRRGKGSRCRRRRAGPARGWPHRGSPRSGTRTGAVAAAGATPAVRRQRRVALDQARQRAAIQPSPIVDDSPAHLAGVAGAPRDAREPRHERRFPRVGQDDRLRVALRGQGPGQGPALRPIHPSMAERGVEDAADALHPRIDGSAPRGRQHVDGGVSPRRPEARHQRLGKDRVADPRRRDDEDAIGRRQRGPARA